MNAVADPKRLGRPRSAEADQAILAATVRLFGELGYEGLTIEGVAALAGVSKATIYRRYDTKLDVVVAAMSCLAAQKSAAPDTGRVEADLQGHLDNLVGFLTGTEAGRLFPALVGETLRYPELADAYRRFVTERRAAARAAVERGIARGELRPDTDPDVLGDMLVGPIFYRVLISGAPVDTGIAAHIVRAIMAAFGTSPTRAARPGGSPAPA